MPPPPVTVDTWAWCGVDPDDQAATTAVRVMAQAGGIDATFGPCNTPKPPYSPVSPSDRYVSFDTYMKLVQLNASVGMKTIVYDDRLWSADQNVRSTAINYWTPVLANIAAWDLGDEYDPTNATEWRVLKTRWNAERNDATARTGIRPFTSFKGDTTSLDKALVDLPGVSNLLSFDLYTGQRSQPGSGPTRQRPP